MSMHWVVIADAWHARILDGDDRLDRLTLVRELEHPESKRPVRDLVSGDRGRAAGTGGRKVAMDRHSDPHRVEMSKFAAQVAAELERGLEGRSYERVILCAPSRFLGLLRDALSKNVERRVVASLAEDWMAVPVKELPERIRKHLPDDAGLHP